MFSTDDSAEEISASGGGTTFKDEPGVTEQPQQSPKSTEPETKGESEEDKPMVTTTTLSHHKDEGLDR